MPCEYKSVSPVDTPYFLTKVNKNRMKLSEPEYETSPSSVPKLRVLEKLPTYLYIAVLARNEYAYFNLTLHVAYKLTAICEPIV
jgi:hypothetical protein